MKLSIIIPTLNESRYLSNTILSVRENAVLVEPHEIIVVDCGSTDGTTNMAQELGVRLIQDEGRMIGRASALLMILRQRYVQMSLLTALVLLHIGTTRTHLTVMPIGIC